MTETGHKCPLCRFYRVTVESLTKHICQDHNHAEVAIRLIEVTKTSAFNVERAKPRKVCQKVGYPSRGAADEALRSAFRSKNGKRKECRAYDCPACGYWHLTSQPNTENEAQKAALANYKTHP